MNLRRAAAGGRACLAASAGAADVSWTAGAGLVQRELVERAPGGQRLVRERGPLAQVQAAATVSFDAGAALRADASLASGRLHYDGQTQGGAALASHTGHRDLAFSLAGRPLAPAAWGEAWLGARVLQQRRQIASSTAAQGLRETALVVSPLVRYERRFEAGGWSWRPAIELRASVHHRLAVDYGGAYDASAIAGGRRREFELALAAGANGSPWQWQLAWTRTRQSASAAAPIARGGSVVGTVRQPRIEIDDLGLRLIRAS